MDIEKLLRKVRKLKSSEFKEIICKLNIRLSECNNVDFFDLEEALTHCIYHFKGGMYESLGYDICPCKCFCINCEMIPESEIGVRMQQLGEAITEKNVLFEFLENNPNFKLIIEDDREIRKTSSSCNSDSSISNS